MNRASPISGTSPKLLLIHQDEDRQKPSQAWCPNQKDSARLGTLLIKMLTWEEESSDIPLENWHRKFEMELKMVSQRSPVVRMSQWLLHNTHHLDEGSFEDASDFLDTDLVKETDSAVNQDLTEEGFMNDEDDAKKQSPHFSQLGLLLRSRHPRAFYKAA